MTTLSRLNELVTLAIIQAEHAEGDAQVVLWLAVSLLEETVCLHPDADALERGIGRRGAIEAAEKAGFEDLAKAMRSACQHECITRCGEEERWTCHDCDTDVPDPDARIWLRCTECAERVGPARSIELVNEMASSAGWQLETRDLNGTPWVTSAFCLKHRSGHAPA